MERCVGSSRYLRSVSLLVLAALCSSSIGLQAQASESCEPTPSELLQSIEQRLLTISDLSRRLATELTISQTSLRESERRVTELQSELSGLRLELESWQDSYGTLWQQATGLMNTIAGLQTRLQALSTSYEASQGLWQAAMEEADRSLRRRSLQRWLWAGGALLAGAAIGWGIAQIIQ